MPYYHDQTKKILYHLADNPHIKANTHKGSPSGWTISDSFKITYADNPLTADGKKLTNPESKPAISHFEAKDSREDALQDYFLRWIPNGSVEITAEMYQQLKREYTGSNA